MNKHRFPELAPIPRDVMGVPASSANIERALSAAVEIKSAKKNKIKADLFSKCLSSLKRIPIFFLLNHNVCLFE
jgi:hypothetical protein